MDNSTDTGTLVSIVLHIHDGSINPVDGVSVADVGRLIAAYANGDDEITVNGNNGVVTRWAASDITSVTVSRVPWSVRGLADA